MGINGEKIKIFLIIISVLVLVPSVVASQPSLGTFKKNDCVDLLQTCDDCTYNNISKIYYPDSTEALSESEMTQTDTVFNYTFCDTSEIGEYIVNGFGDDGGTKTIWVYSFTISSSGDSVNTSQSILLLAQFGVVALFFALGRVFSREKWKVKLFFDLSALLMGMILLNSIRIVSAQANALNTMGEVGLYLGIVILLFLFMYMFIHATIEIINKLKNKRDRRWEVSNNP